MVTVLISIPRCSDDMLAHSHPKEAAMANKEQRNNREKRKPKKEKPKAMPHISSYSGATVKSPVKKSG
jgi:hypothetical protein